MFGRFNGIVEALLIGKMLRYTMGRWNKPETDLTGNRYGQLEAIEYVKGSRWLCRCDCGTETLVNTHKLKSGHTTTCGRHRKGQLARLADRGPAVQSIYRRWQQMRYRCNNPRAAEYANYGGRGITYDASWDSFEVFLSDVGIPENIKLQLDRIDNSKGYEKGNVRWVKQKKNLNNKRSNVRLVFDGLDLTIAEWAEKLNINYRTLNNRINRGWAIDRALTTPSGSGWNGS